MAKKNPYQKSMAPWPGLETLGRSVHLPGLDLDLFFFETGNPENLAIIMVHGLGDEADTWRYQIKPLGEKYHVIAIDLPGFGRSDHTRRAYKPDFMMDSILELMDVLGIEKAILMGSSLGGILSQGIAVNHTNRLSGLILVDGALLQPQKMGDLSLRLMQIPLLGEFLYTKLRRDPDAAYETLNAVYHDLEELKKEDQKFLYQRVNERVWSNGQRRAYFSTLRNLMPWVKKAQNFLPDQLKTIPFPTLVIRGEFDQLFSAENAKAIRQAQPNVEVATIAGRGHLPQQENPEIFNLVVCEWLKRKKIG
jgi:pimeloyl-ACP methyl ester carboxylesterase